MSVMVLVADDNALRREDLEELLDEWFMVNEIESKIAVVEDGKAAIDTLLESSFDAALLDIKMPRATGLQVVREVRKQDSNVKLVMLTSSESDDDTATALEYGADAYVVIADDFDALYEQINKIGRVLFLTDIGNEEQTRNIFKFIREELLQHV